ncbi:MAG TPA: DUF389 domain-containing protein [Ignavibacteriaceae bacterium]|nr:DUF389 domain-containing protein [Ignavibacteriaceae bacterium]
MKSSLAFRKVIHFFNLDTELENFDSIHEEIKKGVVFKGTNLWILIFAIVVASVGLNMNSTAVIIGAMLISPLMGPINGMGYGIAIYDWELFRLSVKNYSFAVVASLTASTAYFALSPISTAHSELLARTSPTIYDVLIALFGGLAGIVAISSKQKGNVIPGVAIATALMPPLCTAGYGIATGQVSYFFGAIYLFTINTIFIALASLWISQLLKFPIRSAIEEAKKNKINKMISVVIAIVVLPSIYFGYQLIQQEKFTQSASQYISNVSLFEGNYLLKSEIDPKKEKILLVYGGNQLTTEQNKSIVKKTGDFGLQDAQVIIEQGISFSSLDEKTNEVNKLREKINSLNTALGINQAKVDSVRKQKDFGKVLLSELKSLYPQVTGCGYSDTHFFRDPESEPLKSIVVVISLKGGLGSGDRIKVSNWLKKRLNSENVRVIYE